MAAIVTTIRDLCKRCYTCIRDCPAKAIKVEDGQAKVIEERCIACGNCYKVCAQGAKRVESAVGRVRDLLAGDQPVLAALAPSFPAAFEGCSPGQVVSAVRRLGFGEVLEVAFGAELISREYQRLVRERPEQTIITTPCPAVVSLIEQYYPSLLPYLAPIVSPAVALARAAKTVYRPGSRVVFIGPCIAKKSEIHEASLEGDVDEVLTFAELKALLDEMSIDPATLPESDTDGPKPRVARIFPVSGGLLKTAAMKADVLETDIVVTEGKDNILYIIRELAEGKLSVKFLDVLFCEGCIDGPVIGSQQGLFARKQTVANYVKSRLSEQTPEEFEETIRLYRGVDLRRSFEDRSIPLPVPTEEEIRRILREMKKLEKADELNCGACGYATCREKAIAVYQGLAEPQMCLPYLVDQLQENLAQLERFQRELQATHEQLIQSEKLASMGQLAAGVAHEINNPLGTITIYAHMMMKGLQPDDPRMDDLRMIVEEASRCRSIVSGLLEFARQGKLELEPADVNALLLETIAEVDKQPFFEKVTVVNRLDPGLPHIQADPGQLRQVFSNVIVNAAEAMPDGGQLTVASGRCEGEDSIWISITDTGCGIPEETLSKLFTPFFTTKATGTGTGLGLAIAYGIVKMHRGTVQVQSQVGVGSTFTITLPINGPRAVQRAERGHAGELIGLPQGELG